MKRRDLLSHLTYFGCQLLRRVPSIRGGTIQRPGNAVQFSGIPRSTITLLARSAEILASQSRSDSNYVFKPTAGEVFRINQALPCGGRLTRR